MQASAALDGITSVFLYHPAHQAVKDLQIHLKDCDMDPRVKYLPQEAMYFMILTRSQIHRSGFSMVQTVKHSPREEDGFEIPIIALLPLKMATLRCTTKMWQQQRAGPLVKGVALERQITHPSCR